MEKAKNPDEVELTDDDTDSKNWKGILIALVVILLICGLVVIAIVLVTEKNSKLKLGEPLTFDEIFSEQFKIRKVIGEWNHNLNVFVYRSTDTGDILSFDPSTNSSRLLLKDSKLKSLETNQYYVSPDLNYVLVAHAVQPIYLFSKRSMYKIFSINSSQEEIPFPQGDFWKGKKLQFASWTPKGHSLTFVYNNSLYHQSGPFVTATMITSNENSDVILNGIPDWMYEEEIFKGNKAHWVSPDDESIAYIQFNETRVPVQSFSVFGDPFNIYSTSTQIPYPKAGDTREHINPSVKLFVADTSGPKAALRNIKPPPELVNKDHYITMVQWRDNFHIIVAWSNRVQNKTIITVCNIISADCRENLVENQHRGKGWVFIDNIYLIRGGEFYLIISPQLIGNKGFWKHIAIVSSSMESNGHKVFLTYGAYDVLEISGFDESENALYFISTNFDAKQRHLFRLTLPTNFTKLNELPDPNVECLTCYGECTYVNVKFSLSGQFYVENCLGPDIPFSKIKRSSNIPQEILLLENNEMLRHNLSKKARPKKEYFHFETEDGVKLLGQIYLPPRLNKEHITQYPLLIHTYAGPDTQMVTEEFKMDWMLYLSASENVVTASIDGRGSSGRGNDFMQEVYKRLGTIEVKDQLEGGEYLKKFPFVDKDRIAIWGWSYGGFVASHVLGSKEDTTFRCGIAVAPVTDWRYYDTAYTERFMGMYSENYRGYDNANVSAKAAHFKGKGFLLVHGTADDNVHFQHSVQLMKALTHAGVVYQTQIYPDKDHHLPGFHTTKHLYKTLTKFLQKDCWNGGKPLEVKQTNQEAGQKQKGKS